MSKCCMGYFTMDGNAHFVIKNMDKNLPSIEDGLAYCPTQLVNWYVCLASWQLHIFFWIVSMDTSGAKTAYLCRCKEEVILSSQIDNCFDNFLQISVLLPMSYTSYQNLDIFNANDILLRPLINLYNTFSYVLIYIATTKFTPIQ